jgi:hypothetical protein
LLFVAIVNCLPEKMKELAEFAKARGVVKGVKVASNYGTPVGKGVTVLEAENEAAVFAYFSPMLPFFKEIEVYPALPMEKVHAFQKPLFCSWLVLITHCQFCHTVDGAENMECAF